MKGKTIISSNLSIIAIVFSDYILTCFHKLPDDSSIQDRLCGIVQCSVTWSTNPSCAHHLFISFGHMWNDINLDGSDYQEHVEKGVILLVFVPFPFDA